MAWTDWTYKAGSPEGTLESLSDYCLSVRIVAENIVGKRGKNPTVDYRHGEWSSPRKYIRAANVTLETVLRYTNSAGVVTHADGAAGHVMENFAEVKRIFGGRMGELTRLERISPHEGTVYRDFELLGDANPSQANHIFTWPLHCPKPFWHGAADVDNSGATLTVGGSAPAGGITLAFSTGTDIKITHDDSGDYVQISGAAPAGGVLVNVDAGTCTQISGGADYSNNLVVNRPWWFELDPGTNDVTVTGGTVLTSWVEQWR